MKFLVLTVLLAGCGQLLDAFQPATNNDNQVTIRIGAEASTFSAADQFGRVAVYIGEKSKGIGRSLLLNGRGDSKTLSLPNGNYVWIAVGWEGSGSCTGPGDCSPMQGQARCGSIDDGAAVSLQGGATTININLSSSHCRFTDSSSSFVAGYPSPPETNIKPVNIRLCDNTSTLPGGCNAMAQQYDVSVWWGEWNEEGGNRTVKSWTRMACALSTADIATFGNFFRPVSGNASGADGFKGFAYRVVVHSGNADTCASAPMDTFDFIEGFDRYTSAPGSAASYFYYYNAGASTSQMSVKTSAL